MSRRVLVMVGTKKGAFILDGDERRRDWSLRGPFCDAWPIHHLTICPPATRSGVSSWESDSAAATLYAAGGSEWFGPAVWRSQGLGDAGTPSGAGLTYGDAGPTIRKVWNVTPAHGALYAGVDPAGRPDSFAARTGASRGPTCRVCGSIRPAPAGSPARADKREPLLSSSSVGLQADRCSAII